jgi:hypothetical protein
MYKSATKCNEIIGKWCKNKHGASKIIDTFETYQDPFGKAGGAASLPVAVPFPLDRHALGAIRVQIWMSGMAAEQARNPNSMGTKLGGEGF